MFGSSAALNGYYDQLDDLNGRGRSMSSGEWYRRTHQTMCYADTLRAYAWINLLKHLTLTTTPDVVAIYLIATAQESLLRQFIEDRPYDEQKLSKSYDYARYRYCCAECCDGCYSLAESFTRNSGLIFPKEAYTMATRYLKYRLRSFIQIISDTLGREIDKLDHGTAVASHIYKAVVSQNKQHTELGTCISEIKALNATLIPENATNTWCCPSHYTSTVYDPVKDMNRREVLEQHKFELVDAKFCIGRDMIRHRLCWMCEMLIQALDDNNTGTFNMCKEAFCLLAEVIVYILAAFENYGGGAAHKPDLRNMFKYTFKEDTNSDGVETDSDTARSADSPCWKMAMMLKRLSPSAAICAGELVVDAANKSYSIPMALEYVMNAVCAKHSNQDVLEFLWGEYNWSANQWRLGSEIITKERKKIPTHE